MARESKKSDAMKAFDAGKKVAGKRESEYSGQPTVKASDRRARKMDKGLPLRPVKR